MREIDGLCVFYRTHSADEDVIAHSFSDDIFFPAVHEYTPQAGDVVVDVGAHIGTFSLLAATHVGDAGHVHAIEPSAESFQLLQRNLDGNTPTNATAHHLALAAADGTATLFHDRDGNWGHSTVADLSGVTEEAPALTLASFLSANGIDRCHFMKFNCEGAEFPILLSASDEILRRIGTLLVLYHCDLWPENSAAELTARLEQAGFTTRCLQQKDQRGWIVATRSEESA